MSMKVKGKRMERRMVRGSETLGHDVELGLVRAGTKMAHGARAAGRGSVRAERKVARVTRHGLRRVGDRLRPGVRAKAAAQ
jgi:hypothetical protein